MARMVATKAALSIRLDALADADSKSSLDSATIGIDNRVKLEARLRQREFSRHSFLSPPGTSFRIAIFAFREPRG